MTLTDTHFAEHGTLDRRVGCIHRRGIRPGRARPTFEVIEPSTAEGWLGSSRPTMRPRGQGRRAPRALPGRRGGRRGSNAAATCARSRRGSASTPTSSPSSRRARSASRAATRCASTSSFSSLASTTTPAWPTRCTARSSTRGRSRRASIYEPYGVVAAILPVQLAADPLREEGRARARRRQHRGHQAGRAGAADGAAPGRDRQRGAAARRAQRGPRHRGGRRARRPSARRAHHASPARPPPDAACCETAAENLTYATMELGGKNALMVLDDADLDVAVDVAIEGMFYNQGEACTSTARILVHDSIYDEFLERFAARPSGSWSATGWTPRPTSARWSTPSSATGCSTTCRPALDEGARIVTPGRRCPTDERLARRLLGARRPCSPT